MMGARTYWKIKRARIFLSSTLFYSIQKIHEKRARGNLHISTMHTIYKQNNIQNQSLFFYQKEMETIIEKKKLWDFLDGFYFVSGDEIYFAVCDFIDKQEGKMYWSDCILADELTREYIELKKLSFDD